MPLLSHLPGETPLDDISGLKVKGITTRSELNVVEAENVRAAISKYLVGRLTRKKAPFDYAWVLQLHREMFGEVWDWAGKLRLTSTNVGVPPIQIEPRLFDLLERMAYWKEVSWLEQAAMLHHEAVRIHPFLNGNGRWSRMLANVWLRLNGQEVTIWPEERVGEASVIREEYLQCVRAADEGDYSLLVGLHRRYTA